METTGQTLATAERAAPVIGWLAQVSIGEVITAAATVTVAVATIAVAAATFYTYRVAKIASNRQNKERVQNLKRERAKKLVDITNFILEHRELFHNERYPLYNNNNRYETIIKFDTEKREEKRTKETNLHNFVIVRERKNYQNILSFTFMGDYKVDPMSIEIDIEPQLESGAEKWEVLFDALKSSVNRALIGSKRYHLNMTPYYKMSARELRRTTGLTGVVTGHIGMRSKMDRMLIDAILSVNVDSVKRLVGKITHIDARDAEGKTFLHYAVKDAHDQIISGKNRSTYSSRYPTRLYKGMSKNYAQKIQKNLNCIVSILINKGADVNAQDNRGTPIIYSAASKNNPEVIDILGSAGADVNSISNYNDATATHIASHYGWDDVIEKLIKNGAAINCKDSRGETPLHTASASGWHTTIGKLIRHGLSVDDKNKYEQTPLHKASFSPGGHRAIDELIKNNASKGINYKDKFGETPLHKASFLGSRRSLMTLIHHGADINMKNNNGETPLHKACASRPSRAVETLIDLGANIDDTDNLGETAFHKALSSRLWRAVETLIMHGADVNEKNEMGETPLNIVVREMPLNDKRSSIIIQDLIEIGADVFWKDINGHSPHEMILRRIFYRNNRYKWHKYCLMTRRKVKH